MGGGFIKFKELETAVMLGAFGQFRRKITIIMDVRYRPTPVIYHSFDMSVHRRHK